MKKLIFILAIILFSCEKDDPVFCWDCELTTIYSATRYMTEIVEESFTICDQTEDQIEDYVKYESSLVVIKIGQTTASTEKICTCRKRE